MKTLRFHYELRITFDEPVTQHSFTVRCSPPSDERQQVLHQDIHILPKEFLCENRDSFGNSYFFGRAKNPHDLFEVVSDGVIQTGLSETVRAEESYRLGMFLQQTPYTQPGEELKKFFESVCQNGRMGHKGCCNKETTRRVQGQNTLEMSLFLMEALQNSFSYRQGCTTFGTTAEEAWKLGCGVCQDYAHILISLCRMSGIPARYVAGMLIGEGLSHAWVEVAQDGRWYGLDPTNGVRVLDEHIKISHGRDYNDCLLNQGVFTGTARQTQSVSVRVEEEERQKEQMGETGRNSLQRQQMEWAENSM